MHDGTGASRQLMETVRQLQGMQAEGSLFTQRAKCLLSTEMPDRKGIGVKELGVKIETLPEQFLLGLQPLAAVRQMGHFQAASGLHIAIDFSAINNLAGQFNGGQALRKKPPGSIQIPFFDPLAVIEASERWPHEAAISTAATPAAPVRLEHHGVGPEIASNVISGAQAGIATTNDSDIGFAVAVQGAVIFGFGSGGGGPIAWGMVEPRTRA